MRKGWISLLLALCLAGCGSRVGTQPSAGDGGPVTIGASGGVVTSADGVRVTVPTGSLGDPVTLRIARDTTGLNPALTGGTPDPTKAVALSPTYSMTPHGTNFSQPAELRIPIDKAAAAGPGLLVALHAPPGQASWDVLPIKAVVNGEAVVSITSFSYYKVVKLTTMPQQLPGVPPAPPKLEMTMTLGGAQPTNFKVPGAVNPNYNPRRLYGTIATRTDSLRLSGRVIGLPASCSDIVLAGTATVTHDPTAADTRGGQYSGWGDIYEPVFAEVTATQGVDNTGGIQRTTLDFQFDINVANAPYKKQLFEALRAGNTTGPTPPVGLTFNAFARSPTPIDFGGGIVLQNWKITPGIVQVPFDPNFPDQLAFDDKSWAWNTILFTTDYLPQGFITHPESVTVAAGTPASFSTSAWSVPVGEQRIEWWRSDNDGVSWTRVRTTLVPVDATADTYTIPVTSSSDNNALFRARLCTVPRTTTPDEVFTDGIAARLTVMQGVAAASFTQQPRSVLVRTGQTASFSVTATGSPAPTLRWQARAANSNGAWADVTAGSGYATTNYTTAALALSDNGMQLRAVANNPAGDVGSVPVSLSVSDVDVAPSITSQPAGLNVVVGSEVVFAVVAHGTEALSYQWRRDGVAITGANAPVLKLAAVTEADAAGYAVQVINSAGTVTSDVAALQVSAGTAPAVAPTIVTQPVSVLVNAGNTATFAVGVSGSGPISYQWLRNATPISGATAAFYSIASAAVSDAGTYAARVSNSAGSVTSWNVVLTVNQAGQPPAAVTLTTQPSPQIQAPGGSATFAVAASGSGPITYQWLKDGAPIADATSGVLTLTNLVAADAANYSVTAGNSLGSVTSNAASLTVLGVPAITAQPVPATVTAGHTATFSVTATGLALNYQWLRNSVAIAGAVEASYTTPALAMGDGGAAYSVLVYNGAGALFSSTATLTVLAAPVGKLTLVANGGVTNGTNGLSVYLADATTGSLTFLNNVNAGNSPYAIAVSPSGLYAYVTNQMGGTVSSYSIDSANGVISPIPLSSPGSNNASGIAMDRLGRFIWVANYGWHTLSAFSIGANGVLAAVGSPLATLSALPYAITAHPTLDTVYVAHGSSDRAVTVYGVNPATGALTLRQTLSNVIVSPTGLVVDPSGRFAYAISQGGGVSTFAINASTGLLTYAGATSTSGSSFAIAAHPNGQYVYVTDGSSGNDIQVLAINQSTGALTLVGAPYATGNYPRGVAVNAAGTFLYVTNYGSNSVTAFSISGGGGILTSMGTAASTGVNPQGIATLP